MKRGRFLFAFLERRNKFIFMGFVFGQIVVFGAFGWVFCPVLFFVFSEREKKDREKKKKKKKQKKKMDRMESVWMKGGCHKKEKRKIIKVW